MFTSVPPLGSKKNPLMVVTFTGSDQGVPENLRTVLETDITMLNEYVQLL
jgi:hypothetical protein